MSDKILKEAFDKISAIEEAMDDSIHDKTIDFLDDMLAGLDKNEQYGERGDMLRYALTTLQAIGIKGK